MNSAKILLATTFRRSSMRSNLNIMVLQRISSFEYFTSKEMRYDTKTSKNDNIDELGECSCGNLIVQQWRSCHPVYVLGRKKCEQCDEGCIEYVNQQYGDVPLNKCCNQKCISNKEANKSFLSNDGSDTRKLKAY